MPQGNTYPAPELPLTGTEQLTIFQQQGATIATCTATTAQLASAPQQSGVFGSLSSTTASIGTLSTAIVQPTVAGAPVDIKGELDAGFPAAGYVGELKSAVVDTPTIGLTTGTPANITSLVLTAGNWDVWGLAGFSPAGTTVMTAISASLSLASATQNTSASDIGAAALAFTNGQKQTITVPGIANSASAGFTVYLVGQATFTTSTVTTYGRIMARRRS